MEKDLTFLFGFIVLAAISIAFIGASIYLTIENSAERSKAAKAIARTKEENFHLKTLKRTLRAIQFVEDCFPKSLPRNQQIDEFYKYDCERWKMQSELDSIREDLWRAFEAWRYKSENEVREEAVEFLDNARETLKHYSHLREIWQNQVSNTTSRKSNIEIEKSADSYIEEVIRSIKSKKRTN